MRVLVRKDYEAMSKTAAEIVASLVKKKPGCILGLATGSTPVGMYRELAWMCREENLCFSKVKSFNLDEYFGIAPDHDQSYRCFMNDNLFNHININKENTRVPDGLVKLEEVEKSCADYEKAIKDAGGVDLQVLGIGGDGHIGFNEPGSSLASRTRLIALDEQTREDNARFFSSIDEVPRAALTMGVGTVLEAKCNLLLANSQKKAEVVAKAIEGPVTNQITASALQLHPNTITIVDEEAASTLKRKEHYIYAEKMWKELGGSIV